MQNASIELNHITKIEGGASLHLKVEDNKVKEVKFITAESKRFFTEAMKGKVVAALPAHLARICGTCSNAHLLCAIEACEHALGIEASPQTKVLRALTNHGLIIRDHALHLYLFCLPDVLNVDAFLDLDENDPVQGQMLSDGFDIKAAGNHLAILVSGRSVHAMYPVVGGFLHFPDEAGIKAALEKLHAIRPAVLRTIEIFKNAPLHFDRKTQFMALIPEKGFGYFDGYLETSKGERYGEDQFRNHLEHVVLPYSQASAYTYDKEGYMVGALARLNLAKEKLHPKTKESAAEALKLFPSTDIFLNNLAQAIEILHSVDESIDILTNTKFVPEPVVKAAPKAGVGIGVIEAPRGTLYHKVVVGADGKITEGEVIVPTGQNQINIERDVTTLVERLLPDPNMTKEKIELEIEHLIRAYDPCMSCAAHFLKVVWG